MGKFSMANTFNGLLGGKSPAKLDSADIDSHVTDKPMNGLFKVLADEEKNISVNPVARPSDLLQKILVQQ